MKLEREAHGLYLRFKDTDAWQILGLGIDDMSVEMNGTYENGKDVTGQNYVTDTGYEPTIAVDPYKANTDDVIYPYIKNIAGDRLTGDKAKAKYLETWIDDPEATEHTAWMEDCYVDVTSYGGDTSALGIPFTIRPAGNRVRGKVTFKNKVPTFVADSDSEEAGLGD